MKNYDEIIKKDLTQNWKKYITIISLMFVFFIFSVILMVIGMKYFKGKHENTKIVTFKDEIKNTSTFNGICFVTFHNIESQVFWLNDWVNNSKINLEDYIQKSDTIDKFSNDSLYVIRKNEFQLFISEE